MRVGLLAAQMVARWAVQKAVQWVESMAVQMAGLTAAHLAY